MKTDITTPPVLDDAKPRYLWVRHPKSAIVEVTDWRPHPGAFDDRKKGDRPKNNR